MRKHEKNRKLLHEYINGTGVVLPGTYNALIAKQIEKEGFQAVYISGGALSASMGIPDIGLLSLNDFTYLMKFIVDAVDLPVVADADTGFGGPINVGRTIQEYEKTGLSGFHIEDQILPKRCGHLSGKTLVSSAEMCQKIQIAKHHRTDPNFLIIARTDAKSVEGIERAIARAKSYLEAGADAIFPEALNTIEEFKYFAQQVKAPLLANMTEFGKSPLIESDKLIEMGYKMVIFPVSSLRIASKSTENFLKTLKKDKTQSNTIENMQTRLELYDLIDYDKYAALDKKVANYKPK